jgi:type I restriction enzyme S subunit
MALTKYKLGDLIAQRREKYDELEELPIRGVSREGFIPPKQEDADLSMYNVFYRNDFVFNPARMELNSIALNVFFDKAICSSLYEIFYVKREDLVLPEYLNLFIKRDEFARKCWFEAIGSARNYFRVPALAEFDIELPDIPTQQKYVDIYKAMVANQQSYERGLEDLKLVCDGYIEDLRRKHPCEKIGKYIERHDIKNGKNGTKNVMGISTSKQFREPTSKVNKEELANYKVCRPRQIGFVQTTHNEKVFAYAFNNTNEDIVISSVNEVFSTQEDKLYPEYLCMFFNRAEFDRYARFHSWGSARETFTWSDLVEVKIPIPDIQVQKAIASIYSVYIQRKEINERLKAQIKDICPILIKGSLEEGK